MSVEILGAQRNLGVWLEQKYKDKPKRLFLVETIF